MAPFTPDPELARPHFAKLRELLDDLRRGGVVGVALGVGHVAVHPIGVGGRAARTPRSGGRRRTHRGRRTQSLPKRDLVRDLDIARAEPVGFVAEGALQHEGQLGAAMAVVLFLMILGFSIIYYVGFWTADGQSLGKI